MTTLTLPRAASTRWAQHVPAQWSSTKSVLDCHRCRGLHELPEIRDDLLRLRQTAILATPNNHPAIYAATVAARAEAWNASITLFRSEGRCRAAILGRRCVRRIPLRLGYFVTRTPLVRSLDVVYGGLLHDGSARALHAVSLEIRRHLDAGTIDHIMINHLPLRDPLFDMITDRSRFPSATQAGAVQPHHRFTLAAGGFEQTLRRFSRKHRYNLRRADRLLCEQFDGELHLAVHDDAAGIGGFLKHAAAISAAGYQGRVAASSIASPVQQAVLESAAGLGSLRCYLLRGGKNMIAYQMGVVIDGTYWLLSTAFHPRYERFSPGQVLLLRALEDLAAQDVRTVDYGFGDAPYKRMYGNGCEAEATIHLYADTPRGAIARMLHEAREGTCRRIHALLDRSGMTQQVRKQWRRRLTSQAPMTSATAPAEYRGC